MPRRKSTKILADEASKAPFQDPKANDLAIIMPSVNHSKPIVLGDRVKVYGHFFPKAEFPNMLAVELWCFLHGLGPEVGGLGKYQHFKNSVDLWFNDPKVDCTKRFDWHPWAVEMAQAACENQYLAIAGCASSGKCLAPHTLVLMHDGSTKAAKDIIEGDLLMGDDSTPRRVLSTNTGRSNMVRIVPNRGKPWECNDDHILCLKRTWSGKSSSKRIGEVVEISVKEYLSKGKAFKARFRQYSTAVEFPEQPLEFDPHIYGLWLGDGTTKAPTLTCHDSEEQVRDLWCGYFQGLGYCVSRQQYNDNCPAWSANTGGGNRENPFLNFIRGSVVDGRKRIRKEYLLNSRANRLKLLAGIIDTDGYAAGTYFEISSSNDGLAEDIVFLARSLGFGVSSTKRFATCNGNKFPAFRIVVCGDVEEIPTLRKKCAKKTIRMNSNCTGFKVEQLGVGDWCGFTLDGNGRFLLDDFTVTHNTDFAAMWALINWLAAPLNTMVLVTSTTLKDSRRRIWGSVREYFQARQGLPGKLVDSYGLIRLDDPSGKFQGSDRCGISLIAAEKKMEKEAVGKLIGFKNQRVIMVADELPELSSAILEACYGNLSRNPEFQLLGLGNPNSYYDAFGQFAKPKGGWSSINSESHIWETERGRCLRFDGKLSPNLAAGKTIYPYLLTQERYDEDVRQFGENSATFWRMIRGFWSPTGTLESVYSEADIIRSKADEKVVWVEPPIRLAALDPSFTNGGDRTVAVIGSYGTSIGPDGNPLTALQFDEFHILYEDILDTKTPRTFQIATAFRNLCLEHGITPDNAALDASGAGTPFADVLSTLWSNKVHRINFAGRASDVPVSAFDQTPSRDRYANRVSEIWFSGRELMHMGQLKGVTPEMAREMCARLYKTEKGVTTRVRVEPKPDMKERTKGVSPDLADAAFILLDLCRSKFRMASVAQAADRPTGRKNSWMQIARRSDVVSRSNRRLRR